MSASKFTADALQLEVTPTYLLLGDAGPSQGGTEQVPALVQGVGLLQPTLIPSIPDCMRELVSLLYNNRAQIVTHLHRPEHVVLNEVITQILDVDLQGETKSIHT